MRNIFDQYTQPENRLTHALVCALDADPQLLRRFVKWITKEIAPKPTKIVEQQLPGEVELDEAEYGRRGLPDAWIHNDDTWSLLIESKVASTLSLDQLQRHYRTAKRRGFEDVTVLAIDVTTPTRKLPSYVLFKTWREIYAWLARESYSSEWALRTLRYIEVAERKWPTEGYLKEGTLTEFTGFRFDENNPYSYAEGKRLIHLMMDELREHPALRQEMRIDRKADGRGAITGKRLSAVWDYLRIKGLDSSLKHTKHPHLTLVITHEQVRAFLNIPNSLEIRFRRAVIDLGEDGFLDVVSVINRNMKKVLRSNPGAYPFANIQQRRFAARGSIATVDGKMEFDLRTAFTSGKQQKVKVQSEWLAALYALICNKNSNLEYAVGVAFPYQSCPNAQQTAIVDAVANSWIACKPLLDVILKE